MVATEARAVLVGVDVGGDARFDPTLDELALLAESAGDTPVARLTARRKAPDAALVGLAGLRSKHNTYMSVPLIFFMISNHYPTTYGNDFGFALVAGFIAVGWGVTKFLYNKSASDAPKSF